MIREALAAYRDEKMRPRHSLRDLTPFSLGEVLHPLQSSDDLLEEMRDD